MQDVHVNDDDDSLYDREKPAMDLRPEHSTLEALWTSAQGLAAAVVRAGELAAKVVTRRG